VKEKGFSEDRVKNGCAKLRKAKGSAVQGRLTSFFGEPTVVKRKHEEETTDAKKKSKTSKSPVKGKPTTPKKGGMKKKN
jgi:flap endonuclease-1